MIDHAARIAALSPKRRELLLQRLKEKQGDALESGPALPAITPNPQERYLPFPLTDIQKAYWVGRSGLFDLSRGANVYVEDEITYQLPPGKSGWIGLALGERLIRTLGRKYLEKRIAAFFVDRLNLGLQRLIERHDMLRAIVLPDSQQQVLPQGGSYPVKVADLRGQPPHRAEAELAKLRERMRYTPVPMDQWPLFEFWICLLPERRIRVMARIDPVIIDGESRSHLVDEWGQLLLNPRLTLPPIECTYRDYAVTWAACQASEPFQRSRAYWRAQLPTLPAAPELPLIQPIGPLLSPRFDFLFGELLDAPVWQQLKARAARIGLSASGIALAAFVEVLATWSLEPRFTLGLIGTYHPPMHRQIQEVVGNFNSLALLAVENQGETFQDRAIRLWKQLMTDLDHRYYSGQQVLQDWRGQQGASPKALIPIYFNSVIESSQPNPSARQHGAESTAHLPAPDLYQIRLVELGAYFPQILFMSILQESNSGALTCKWQLVSGVFPPGLIEDMLKAYRSFLQRLADDDHSWQATARRLLPPDQLAQRDAFTASEAPLSQAMLPTLFMEQLTRQPAQIAVIAGAQRLTYETVYHRANQIGRRLRESGAGPNTLVAVIMEPGVDQIVAVLGVLLSGAAYLPIDPHLAPSHQRRLLDHSEVKLVLTQARLDKSLEWPERARRLCVDDPAEWAAVTDHPLDLLQTPEALAYVIYPAASADQLKGVMVSHQGAVNTILDINRRWRVGPQDRILALCPLSSDLSVYDIFGIWAAGGTLIVPAAEAARDPAKWAELIAQHAITLWNSPPALLEVLLAYLIEHRVEIPQTLRLVLLSRDRISTTLPDRLKSLAKDVEVIGLSGALETSLWFSLQLFQDIQGTLQGSLPIANQHLYVLDSRLEPRPVWVPGDVYVGGIGLAQGFWKDEDQTRLNFVQDPHTGERLYRTGEMGRFLPDGTLEWLGPKQDWQATVYGYRVELRQVEMVLEQHPAVRECIVVDHKDSFQRNRLIAYIVPHSGNMPTPDQLRDFVKTRLPDYMLPGAFMLLKALPLTSEGQIDRDALPRPPAEASQSPGGNGRSSPHTALERRLVQIWEVLLDTRPIGLTDNFFELGGNSFLAVCLINQLQSEFKVEQPWHTFLYDPTIKNLCQLVRIAP